MNDRKETTSLPQNSHEEAMISLEDINNLREFGNKILLCTSIEEISDILFQEIATTISPQVSSLFLFLKNGLLERVNIRGQNQKGEQIQQDKWLPRECYERGESFSGKVVKPEEGSTYGKPILSNDIKNDYKLKYFSDYDSELGFLECGISVPLNGTHYTFGTVEVLNKIDSKTGLPNPNSSFTQKDLCWLTIVGAHVSAAISRLRKQKQDEVRAYLTGLLVAKRKMTNINDVAQKVAHFLIDKNLMPYKVCIFRFACPGDRLNIFVAEPEELIKGQRNNAGRGINEGLVGRVYQTGEPIEINKTKDKLKLFLSREWIEKVNLESFFCFPLIYQGKSVGTMSIFTGYEHELFDSERKFLQEISLLLASCQSAIDEQNEVDSLKNLIDEMKSSSIEQKTYVQNLEEIVSKKESRSKLHYSPKLSLQKVAPLLLHQFKIIERKMQCTSPENNSPIILPMLVRVRNHYWQAKDISDYQEFYRSEGGRIHVIGCKGSYQTVVELNDDMNVISVESDSHHSNELTDWSNEDGIK
jgi:GAF domain-containing protein